MDKYILKRLIFELQKTIELSEVKTEIDITNFSRGIYYLQLGVEEEVFLEKIVKH